MIRPAGLKPGKQARHVQVEVFQNFDVSTPTRAQGFRAERSHSETYERVYRFRNVENAVDVRIPKSFSCKATPIAAKKPATAFMVLRVRASTSAASSAHLHFPGWTSPQRVR